mmetsp:Transcript_254/g.477  ORF Transcript_254/g.477 Transcript_254/m.477 type:complete len:228 (+) Transcript_254:251-934(+)
MGNDQGKEQEQDPNQNPTIDQKNEGAGEQVHKVTEKKEPTPQEDDEFTITKGEPRPPPPPDKSKDKDTILVDPKAPLVDPEGRASKSKVPIPIPGFEQQQNTQESSRKNTDEIQLDPFAPPPEEQQQSIEPVTNPFETMKPDTPLGDIPSDIFLDLLAESASSSPNPNPTTETNHHPDFITTTDEGPVPGAVTSEGNPFTEYVGGENLADFLHGTQPSREETADQQS